MGTITSRKKATHREITFPSFIKDWNWDGGSMVVIVPLKITKQEQRDLFALARYIERAAELSSVK